MMDYFYIFQYTLSSLQSSEKRISSSLRSIKYTKINVNLSEIQQFKNQQNSTSIDKLDEDITSSKVLFKKFIQQIVKEINEVMINFFNVTLICSDLRFFTEVIPRQCQKRDLAVPYVMMNFLDLKELLRTQLFCPFTKWSEIAQYMQVCSVKQSQLKTSTQILEKILKKLHKDKKIPSTNERFSKRCQKLINQFTGQYEKNYKYFKIIGLPFRCFPSEILQTLAPQVSQNQKQLIFIYERERFSGRGMIKIPQDYEKFLIEKNRMYIGSRYIQLQISSANQFQKAKINLEQKDKDKSPRRQHREKQQYDRNVYKIGRRRSHSRSPDRSRQKHSKFNDKKRQKTGQNPFQNDFNLNTGQSAIKLRGLPFSFSQWDVQNMFSFYNIVGGSVKLGIKPGTSLNNGQAVVLMRSYSDAQKALDMNGFRCGGRYVQVWMIGKDEYVKYR